MPTCRRGWRRSRNPKRDTWKSIESIPGAPISGISLNRFTTFFLNGPAVPDLCGALLCPPCNLRLPLQPLPEMSGEKELFIDLLHKPPVVLILDKDQVEIAVLICAGHIVQMFGNHYIFQMPGPDLHHLAGGDLSRLKTVGLYPPGQGKAGLVRFPHFAEFKTDRYNPVSAGVHMLVPVDLHQNFLYLPALQAPRQLLFVVYKVHNLPAPRFDTVKCLYDPVIRSAVARSHFLNMISMVRTPCDSFYSSYRVESYHVHDRKFVHCVHSYWSLIYYTHILYISKLKASKNVKT